MLKHFYRLMVVMLAALTATAATGCSATDYGAFYIPYDDKIPDADTSDDDTLVND